jgi:hypothetical protein
MSEAGSDVSCLDLKWEWRKFKQPKEDASSLGGIMKPSRIRLPGSNYEVVVSAAPMPAKISPDEDDSVTEERKCYEFWDNVHKHRITTVICLYSDESGMSSDMTQYWPLNQEPDE